MKMWCCKGGKLPKIVLLTVLLLICGGITYYSHFIRHTEVVFTHFFYVPIVLAAIWWARPALLVAVFMGIGLLVSHAASGVSASYGNDILRIFMFVVISAVVGTIWRKCLKTEKNLRAAKDYLNNLINNSGSPILVCDAAGRITLYNGALEKMTGRKAEDMIGKYTRGLFTEEAYSKIQETFACNYAEPVEAAIKCPEGDVFCLWTSSCIFSPDGTEQIATLIQGQDISKRKWAEGIIKRHAGELSALNTRLAISEKNLREMMAAKDKFFSIISHDLRSPFMPLMNISQTLEKEIGELPPDKISEYVHILGRNVKRLYNLMENLLEWSEIQTGRMECVPSEVELGKKVHEIVDLYLKTAEQKEITLSGSIEDGIFVYADPNHVSCVIRNLVSNAIKYTHAGGRVSVSSHVRNGTVEIVVADDGIGMNEETLRKIFRIDVYQSTPGTAREKGNGLGLILCKELVEKNNGTIAVESNPGRGSTFTVILPRKDEADLQSAGPIQL